MLLTKSTVLAYVIILCGLSASAGPSKDYTDTVPDLSGACSDRCDQLIGNAISHARAWCSNEVKTGYSENHFQCVKDGEKWCTVTGRVECKDKPPTPADWYYALLSTSTPQDRETELDRIAGGRFKRIGGTHVNTNWHTVCARVGLSCTKAMSWDNKSHDCGGGAHDGSRMALCQ